MITSREIKIKTKFGEYYFNMTPWVKMLEGGIYRTMTSLLDITSKTRRFSQVLYSCAAIPEHEIPMEKRVLSILKKDKTQNMVKTAVSMVEITHGKGITFPNMRGRFTVLKIENGRFKGIIE